MQRDIAVKRLVLVGGGHGHVHVIKMLGMDPVKGVDVTLITRDVETPYSGMLPGFVAGHYERSECHVDLAKLCSFSGVALVHAEACRLDRERREVHCSDGRPPIRYDVLSIDVGISPKPLPEVFQVGRPTITPVKPIDGFARRWDVILARALAAGATGKPVRLAVVGGGAGGTELCFAMHHRLQRELAAAGAGTGVLHVTLYSRGPTLVAQHNKGVQRILARLAREKGITIELQAEIVAVEMRDGHGHGHGNGSGHGADSDDILVAADGRRFPFDEAIWCTDAAAQPWLKETGLDTTDEGFIRVAATLESCNTPGVFACGDVAHLTASPRPKAGVFAVRAGPPLVANIRRALLGQPLEPWTPQEQFLGIVGTGDAYAVASKGPVAIEGAFLWKLKDKVDRTWMAIYNDLPDKESMMRDKARARHAALVAAVAAGGAAASDALAALEERESGAAPPVARAMGADTLALLSAAQMRCGGCGSKVGAQVLTRALRRVRARVHHRDEVVCGVATDAHDDAALLLPPPAPAYLVHTLDYFRSFVSDPYLFGQIAANHALSDVHAMNGEPVSALALAVLPYGPEDMVEDALVQMLAGCLDVLRREGCALVGGHTSEGAEPALGLSVHGTVHPAAALRKALPARAVAAHPTGLALLLTKPLGTGALMAAHMRAQARGEWVQAAYASMRESNRPAAQALAGLGCLACTDVTGFGLVGHLLEMLHDADADDDNGGDGADGNSFGAGAGAGAAALRPVVTLHLSRLPALPGAVHCVHTLGVTSSLHPQNVRCVRALVNPPFGRQYPSYPLLFDPQTAGGLLAAVPAEAAAAAVAALVAAGCPSAAVVGHVALAARAADSPSITLAD